MRKSWTGIVLIALVLAAAIGALALGDRDLAVLLGTGALGILMPSPIQMGGSGG